VFCILGCCAMVSFTGEPVSLTLYLTGFTLVLAFTNILEGVSMSVLSKVIHPILAKGTFNAGTPYATLPMSPWRVHRNVSSIVSSIVPVLMSSGVEKFSCCV
jgi:hypothetical protein